MSSQKETRTSRGVWRVPSLARSPGPVNLLLFVLSLVVVMTIAVNEPSVIQPHGLQKRSLYRLCILVNRFSRRSCWKYINYGCYCGLGNRNHAPLDATDRCCQAHDHCYGRVEKLCFLSLKLVMYDVNCGPGASCSCPGAPDNSECEFNLCQCDLTFAECLQNTSYNTCYIPCGV